MTIAKSTYTRTVLIVLNENGTLRGAHQERVETITNDGTVISSRVMAAEPVSPEALAALLPDRAALLAQVQSLTDDLEAARAATPGATPQDGELPVLSAVQVRLGLLNAGIFSKTVESVIQSIPDAVERERAHTYWDYSTSYHRSHPLVTMLGTSLGLSEEQIDEMWHAAALIE